MKDLLSIDGIDEKLAKELIDAHIPNAVALANTTVARLTNPDYGIGISPKKAKKIIAAAKERCDSLFGFESKDKLIQRYDNREHLTTGTQGLDSILGGNGFETETLYELYGFEEAGKEVLLHQLACTAYLPPEKGGLATGSIYIDTEGMFSIEQIERIAQRFKIDPEALKSKIVRVTPPDSDTLVEFCESQMEMMAFKVGARLFCLDNFASYLLAEYGGVTETLPERQQKAKRIGAAFRRAVVNLRGIAIYTNQMKREWGKPQGTFTYALGLAVGFIPNVRIRLDIHNEVKGLREFKIEKAHNLPNKSVILRLKEDGFFDLRKKVSVHKTP